MARYIDLENPMVYLGGYTPDGYSVYHVPSNTPTADVVDRKDLISFLLMIVSDLNKEMDECLELGEPTCRFYLKAKRSMVEHLIGIFEEADDAEIH